MRPSPAPERPPWGGRHGPRSLWHDFRFNECQDRVLANKIGQLASGPGCLVDRTELRAAHANCANGLEPCAALVRNERLDVVPVRIGQQELGSANRPVCARTPEHRGKGHAGVGHQRAPAAQWQEGDKLVGCDRRTSSRGQAFHDLVVIEPLLKEIECGLEPLVGHDSQPLLVPPATVHRRPRRRSEGHLRLAAVITLARLSRSACRCGGTNSPSRALRGR
jgi:hypothetical protein